MNDFNTVHFVSTTKHLSSLCLLSWRNSIRSRCVGNLPFTQIDSLELLARLRIVIKTICLIILRWITINDKLRLWAFCKCFAFSISAQLLQVLSGSLVMRHHLVHLVLLQHRNDFPWIISVIFHFRHALSAVGGHINWVLLLIDLHNLSLLLDGSIRCRVEASLYVSTYRIRIRIHSLMLLTASLNINWLVQRHLLRAFVLVCRVAFGELRFELRNTLHASASWKNDGSSLATGNLVAFFAHLLCTLKPILALRALLAVWPKPYSLSRNLCCIVQCSNGIIPGTFKLVLVLLIALHIGFRCLAIALLVIAVFKVLGVLVAALARELPGIIWHCEILVVLIATFATWGIVVHHLHILWHIMLSFCLLLLSSHLSTITWYRSKRLLVAALILNVSYLRQLCLRQLTLAIFYHL